MSYLWLEVHFSDLLTSSLSDNNTLLKQDPFSLLLSETDIAVISKFVYFAVINKISQAFIIFCIDFLIFFSLILSTIIVGLSLSGCRASKQKLMRLKKEKKMSCQIECSSNPLDCLSNSGQTFSGNVCKVKCPLPVLHSETSNN